MNVTLLHGLAMFAAAFVGGMMNSIAGGGTLLTFPVLLWLGLDPKVANATSTVALWPGLLDIHRANGIKNFLGICINFVAIIGFTIAGLVYWPDALFMAVAAIAGGYFGASSARRLGRVFVRRTVVLIGLTIGIVMLW